MSASPGRGSQRKGAAAERELVKILHEYGLTEAHRTEGSGKNKDGDITNVPGLHLEAKRTETFSPYKNYEQANSDRGIGPQIPVVAHRKNAGQWMVFLSLADFMKLYLAWQGMDPPDEQQPELS